MVTVHEGLVFGGPMNEQYVAGEGVTMRAILPTRIDWAVADSSSAEVVVPYRTMSYEWEWYTYGGHLWGCWVADGYPRHRITDALNMILGLTRLMTGM